MRHISKGQYVILIIVVAGMGGFVMLVLPGLRSADRDAHERNASVTLKALATAEADFRTNDRDKNGVNDFWTGDVSGLYSMDLGAGPLKLIPREVAEADAAPLKPLVPTPIPFKGYLFRVLEVYRSEKDSKDQRYQQDTGGTPRMGNVHHTDRFGFLAYPARFGETGTFTFLLNENGTVFRMPEDGTTLRDWPMDEDGGVRTRHDAAPPTPLRKVQNAVAELPRTTVTAYLEEKHVPGKNLIWCATSQMAWDKLGELFNQSLDLEGAPPMTLGLNRKLVKEEHLPPGKYYARAGFFKDGIVRTIQSEMAQRFPSATLPSWPSPDADDEALAFAYLFTNLPFEAPLFRHAGIKFKGRKVAAFGLWDGHGKVPTSDQMKQVIVRDFRSDADFVVDLLPKGGEDRIIVARISPGATLLETVTSVMNRLDGSQAAFHAEDDLMIPCVNFELLRSYSEVMGPTHRIKGRGSWIGDAQQMIRFRFDEQGALLESYTHFWTVLDGDPPRGRKMICEGPFLILLVRQSSRMPYFAFWVDNDELLIQ